MKLSDIPKFQAKEDFDQLLIYTNSSILNPEASVSPSFEDLRTLNSMSSLYEFPLLQNPQMVLFPLWNNSYPSYMDRLPYPLNSNLLTPTEQLESDYMHSIESFLFDDWATYEKSTGFSQTDEKQALFFAIN